MNKKSKLNVKSILGIIFSLLMLFSLAIACDDGDEQASKDIQNKKAEVKVSAYKLVKDYKSNEVSADEKYKGKIIAVSGRIKNIGKGVLDTIYVQLYSGIKYSFESVRCDFPDSAKKEAASLKKGQKVTLKGIGDGKTMDILLKACRLVK